MTSTKEKSGRRYPRPKSVPATDDSSAKSKTGENIPPTPSIPRETKIGKFIALLTRNEGATLDEMIEATGWQPHTARVAMSGLRKKGYTIDRGKLGEATCYRIISSPET